ncbi:MAG: hypothetical protein JWN99_473, partial [Ilumatobacteraceae bacterium]|nr:hypothetical protein [Ilumatobacteraceae bacterium]
MRDRGHQLLGGLAAVSIVALAALGLTRSSGPPSSALPQSSHVVLISVPGLRWQDLDAIPTDHLQPLLNGSALLSVRSLGTETSVLEGYLALGAGNRLDSDPTGELSDPAARCLPQFVQRATDEADDGLNGAEPGALGTALDEAGLTTAVFGSTDAVAGLMGGDGCVGVHGTTAEAAFDADVTLVEFGNLGVTATAAQRASTLHSIDAAVGALALPDDATVIVFAPAAPDAEGEVVVIGVRDLPAGSASISSLVSPSTRRA